MNQFLKNMRTLVENETLKSATKLKKIMAESIVVYHGSDTKFNNFDMSRIGSSSGRSVGGWGIYFTDSKDVVSQYTTKHGFVGKYKIPDGDYFDLDEPLDEHIGNNIVRKMRKMGVDDSEIEQFQTDYIDYIPNITGFQTYEWLAQVIGGRKEASQFLDSIGFAGNTFIDKTEDARNYVIFDDYNVTKVKESDYEEESDDNGYNDEEEDY